ncbi:MAG TPA: hypothetical protein VL947_06080 [Cytophagales bacterium]|nr:hypothetical protein [Cytophagales bacterium]
MTNIENNNYLLTESDTKFIARHLGCSERHIRMVKSGMRGKRNTQAQLNIKKALEFRTLQNHKLVSFCNKIKNRF